MHDMLVLRSRYTVDSKMRLRLAVKGGRGMRRQWYRVLVIGLSLALALGACSSNSSDSALPTVVPTPTLALPPTAVPPPTLTLAPTVASTPEVPQAVAPTVTAASPTKTAAPSETPTAGAASGGPQEVMAAWPVFVDDVHYFALQYPLGWTVTEVDLHNPNQPPPGKMARLLWFEPEGWAESFIALQLEVYVMDDATFASQIPAASMEEVVHRDDGMLYLRLVHDYGAVVMNQMLFRSASDPDVRVIFTDYVTGWPDRLAGNEAVVAQFAPMLESFGFTQ